MIKTMQERIEVEATSDAEAGELWTATNILMALRYNEAVKKQLLQGVRRMRESSTYQEILREGRVEGRVEGLTQGRTEGQLEEARRILLRQGMRRLGIASPATEVRVQRVTSLTVLEDLLDRVLDVETWDDLLSRVP